MAASGFDSLIEVERLERLDPQTRDAIARIIDRSAVHDHRSPIGEHKFVRLLEGEADTFGLLVRLDGAGVAYAQATLFPRQGPIPRRLAAELLVDPEHRGRGIGRSLIDSLLTSAREEGVQRFDVWAHHADAAASGLAAAYRMRISRQLWQMALRLGSASASQEAVPEGTNINLRPFRRNRDEALLISLIREAFSQHPENAVFDAEDLAARKTLPWFDASDILIAEDGTSGSPLGMHWMKLQPPVGEVYILAVSPRAQGRGLGRQLLLAGLAQMRERGIEVAILYVDAGNDAAIGLYRSTGFRFEHLDTCYSVDLGTPVR